MNSKGNILVITYWAWNDALIQTYTLPYVKIIKEIIGKEREITIVSLEKNPNKEKTEVSPGVFNLQLPYRPLGFRAAAGWIFQIQWLLKHIRKNSIETIHAWCTPAGSIAFFLSRLSGKTLIIDSYEPHAEAMVENGSWKKKSPGFRFLFHMEKRMTHHARHLIACTESMSEYARSRYQWEGALFVKPACVDLNLFEPVNEKNKLLLEELGLSDKIIGFYAGKFGGIYLEEEVYRLIRECIYVFGESLYFLLLTNEKREVIDRWCEHYAIPKERIITRFVPHKEVPAYMQLADFALTPVKPIPTKKYCSPIKDGEYWACGIPVVITKNISDDSELIEKHEAGVVIQGLTDSDLRRTARKLKELLDTQPKAVLRNKIQQLAIEHRNFSIAEAVYRKIYGH